MNCNGKHEEKQRLSKDAEFLLSDLKIYRRHSSWDWEADARFAEYLGADSELLNAAINSQAPSVFRMIAAKGSDTIKQRRLKGLRELVRAGYVTSWWSGTGAGGRTQFGVNRAKEYYLKDEFYSKQSTV